jgi:hypothetical protein
MSQTVKCKLKKANADDKEDVYQLVSYAKCWINRFKECERKAAAMKASLRDNLFDEISIRHVDVVQNDEKDVTRNNLIYDLCAFMFQTRGQLISCQECKETVVCEEADLPDEFTAKQYTAFRNRGGLIFVTIPVFQSIREVEKIISSQFEDDGHYLVRDSYEICMSKIKVLNLCPFFCDTHLDSLHADSYPYLIMEFVQVRYHFESNRFQERNLTEVESNVRQNFKMAKRA